MRLNLIEMNKSPKISLLIRNLNEKSNLEILFPILNKQDYPNFDVIFLDSGSSDESMKFVKNFDSNFNIIIDTIKKEDFSFGKALNICAGLTKNSDYLIAISAHCFPQSEKFISNYVKNFKNYDCDILYGKQIGYTNSMLSEASHLNSWFDNDYGIKNPSPFSNNGNCGYRFEIWKEFKFDESLTGCEDIDLASRALHEGKVLAYGEDIEVSHYHQESFEQVYFRYYREALALSSIFTFKFTRSMFFKNLIKEVLRDIRYKLKYNKFESRKIIDIFRYRLKKNYGHFAGFKKRLYLQQKQLFYYTNQKNNEMSKALYNKYFY